MLRVFESEVNMKRRFICGLSATIAVATFLSPLSAVFAADTVKVFLLAGQSNMQGKASLVTLAVSGFPFTLRWAS